MRPGGPSSIARLKAQQAQMQHLASNCLQRCPCGEEPWPCPCPNNSRCVVKNDEAKPGWNHAHLLPMGPVYIEKDNHRGGGITSVSTS